MRVGHYTHAIWKFTSTHADIRGCAHTRMARICKNTLLRMHTLKCAPIHTTHTSTHARTSKPLHARARNAHICTYGCASPRMQHVYIHIRMHKITSLQMHAYHAQGNEQSQSCGCPYTSENAASLGVICQRVKYQESVVSGTGNQNMQLILV